MKGQPTLHMILPVVKTAILIDGGFYRKRAKYFWGEISPEDRASELHNYCMKHLRNKYEQRKLYRIFYYDCPPAKGNVYNPILHKSINLEKTDEYTWSCKFLDELKKKRMLALRLGRLSESQLHYNLKYEVFKSIMQGKKQISDIKLTDCKLNIEQKGVDMRIGVDISSLAFKRQVNQIILIAGDSDFVPAAKQARREGIDFILDPMGAPIKPDLFEHIDGIEDKTKSMASTKNNNSEYKLSK